MSLSTVFCTGMGHESTADKGDLRATGEGIVGESWTARLGVGDR